MQSIQASDKKKSPNQSQEVKKSLRRHKTPPSTWQLPHSGRRPPLICHKFHMHWSSPSTASHISAPQHMEFPTPSLWVYIKTHCQGIPIGHSNRGQWRVLQKQLGHSIPHHRRWGNISSNNIIHQYHSSTSRVPISIQEQTLRNSAHDHDNWEHLIQI